MVSGDFAHRLTPVSPGKNNACSRQRWGLVVTQYTAWICYRAPDKLMFLHCRVLGVQTTPDTRRNILADLLTVYSNAGKVIVFTKTKREADEVAAGIAGLIPSEVVHCNKNHRLAALVFCHFSKCHRA